MSDPSFDDDFAPIARRGQLSMLVKNDERTVAIVAKGLADRLGDDEQVFAVAWIVPDHGEQFPCCFLSRERLIAYAEDMQPHTVRVVGDAGLQAELIEAVLRNQKVH